MKIFNNAPPTAHSTSRSLETNESNRADKNRAGKTDAGTANHSVPVEISDEARFRNMAREVAASSPDVRRDKVEIIKKAIANGTYKVDAAKVADKLVDEHLQTDFGKNNL